MPSVTDVEMLRDGGTIEFRVSGCEADGVYRLQTPFLGTQEPLFKDGRQVELGAAEEAAVLAVLQDWLAGVLTDARRAALDELDKLETWQNLPPSLLDAVPLHRIRRVIRRLSDRCPDKEAE